MMDVIYTFATSCRSFWDSLLSAHFWVMLAILLLTTLIVYLKLLAKPDPVQFNQSFYPAPYNAIGCQKQVSLGAEMQISKG